MLGRDVPTGGSPVRWSPTAIRPGCGKVRSANRGQDIHLVGGLRTIGTFRALGALDRLGLLVLPLLLGDGMRLTPGLNPDAKLVLDEAHPLPGSTVEIAYAFS